MKAKKMEHYSKLGHNMIIIALGSFASKIMTFFMLPFYTQMLSTDEYGTSELIIVLSSLLCPVMTLIISESVMRFLLDKDGNEKQILSIGLYITLAGMGATVMLAPIIIIHTILKPYCFLFLLYFCTSSIRMLLDYFVKGIEKTRTYALSGLINVGSFSALNIILLYFGHLKIEGYLTAYIASDLISIVYMSYKSDIKRYVIPPGKIRREYLQRMVRYSVPMVPNSISWWVANSLDKVMLTAMQGTSAAGIYSVAYKIPSIVNLINNIFINSWQISAVDDWGSDRAAKFWSDIYYKLTTILLLACMGIIAFNKIIASVLFSGSFFEAWKYAPILVAAVFFQGLSAFLGTVFTSAMNTKILSLSTLTGAGENILLNAILIPRFGIEGAAFATLCSYFTVWFIRFNKSKKILPLSWHRGEDLSGFLLLLIQMLCACKGVSIQVSIILFVLMAFIRRKFFRLMRGGS